ncbi:fibronectin type III domain-containing protein [Amnibacterium sp. CER49]|uniref:fibronectin type III domain-containing protein n=1 Tax=Amnibacterium sp. CER49 TaxID=3039161 RepID=UPI00244BE43A|nr:fibronectin type III domain-containing protein [Amnibacterium sp. CER49]MDH2445148.1 fibronectin type III domain-containing protein [Amnibacterium sp. CER49]
MFRIATTAALLALCVGAAATPAVASTTPAAPAHGLGQIAPRTTKAVGAAPFTATSTLPSSVDLTPWTMPVGDQGQVGSCVEWAIDYGMMGWYSKRLGKPTPLAPMYVYSQVHLSNSSDGGGSYSQDAYDIGTRQGVDTRDHYWQGGSSFTTPPTWSEKLSAAHHKAFAGQYLYSGVPGSGAVWAIKTQLAQGHPVALGFEAYDAFMRLDSTHYTLDANDIDPYTYDGGHEVLIVGYNASGVRIQNSWGTSWGQKGFANLHWNFVEQYSDEASYIPGLVATPSVPMHVTASNTASTETLTWAPPVSDGGAPVTGYHVTRDGTDTRGVGAWSTTLPATARSVTIRTLFPNTAYHLRVSAINTIGSGPSHTATVTTGLGAARYLHASGDAATGLATVSWTAPATTGGLAITRYRVARTGTDVNGGGPWGTVVSASARTFSFKLLRVGYPYSITVQPITATQSGPVAAVALTL